MDVYLAGIDPVKGVPARHFIYCNPGNHLGTSAVPAAWTKKDAQSNSTVGVDQIIEFVHGKATVEDALAKYLVEFGHATKQRWRRPLALWEV
jgi:hypothetical protein